MPKDSVPLTSKGWPYIDPELYFRAFPAYTQQLATKLDNADADVAAAINAAATLVLTTWTILSTGFSAIVTGEMDAVRSMTRGPSSIARAGTVHTGVV